MGNAQVLGLLDVARGRLSSSAFFLRSDGVTNAADAAGHPMAALSPLAVRRTLTGTLFALVEISMHSPWSVACSEALALLSEVVGDNVLLWEMGRSQGEVLSAIDRAVALKAAEFGSLQTLRASCIRLAIRWQAIEADDESNRIEHVLERVRHLLTPTTEQAEAEPVGATAELEGAL